MIITTSWDDGHPLDLRISELLIKYGLKGTFYIPLSNPENEVLSKSKIIQLANNHEIGGHTVHHIYLNKLSLNKKKEEIFTCKKILEDTIGKQVTSFCFPGGKYDKFDLQMVKEAGFLFGRTTSLFQTQLEKKSFLMPTTVQLYNHSTFTYLRHCLKRGYFKEINTNKWFIKNYSPADLTKYYLENEIEDFIHIWGHSWEIDKFGLWNELESLLEIISKSEKVKIMNNSELWNMID